MINKLFIVPILFLIFSNPALQADSPDSDTTYSISIFSNLTNAMCYIDSTVFHGLPVLNHKLPGGTYRILIKKNNPENYWINPHIEKQLEIISDTVITFNSKLMYNFFSEPFNAEVFYKGQLLGYTPLRFISDELLIDSVLIRKEEYYDINVLLTENVYNYNVQLEHKLGGGKNFVVTNRRIGFDKPRSWLAIGGFGIATLTAAYSTYSFKRDANKLYDEYVATEDLMKFNESNNKDRYFIISLIAMQAALGALIYFLFFE